MRSIGGWQGLSLCVGIF
jgi:hypothetical protein